MIRRRLTFHGHVQGVGFRATTHTIAERYPLTGWVCNQPDGTVCVEIQGDPPVIELMLIDLSERMSGHITHHDGTTITVIPDEQGFEIRT
ncbi:MAG: acylphosphatase [Planctomycetota bacterium]